VKKVRLAEMSANLGLCVCSILVTLAVAEIALRSLGYRPGYVRALASANPASESVNPAELSNDQIFRADQEGVFKASPEYCEPRRCPDGFRSIPLRFRESAAPKVLFLGDSFTWGHSAEPLENCFVDRVRARGYLCYNTGIPGADPDQYAFLAEKYVPTLKPDFVAVMIFMGNDLDSHLRNPLRPYQNVLQITDRGWYYAFDREGRYMSPAAAYMFAHNLAYQYYKNSGPAVTALVSGTVTGAYFGVGLALLRERLPGRVDARAPRTVDPDYVRGALQRIRKVCDEQRARMLVFLIPDHPDKVNRDTDIAANLQLFSGFEPLFLDSLTREDYCVLPNDHLNNSGHGKYAAFILRILGTYSKPGPGTDG